MIVHVCVRFVNSRVATVYFTGILLGTANVILMFAFYLEPTIFAKDKTLLSLYGY